MSTVSGDSRAILSIPLSRIQSSPDRPRREFSEESVDRLAESIRLHGLLSPLLVRQAAGEQYRLIAGERRLRALKKLNRRCADAIVLTGNPCDCALIALVENLQREPLHFLDMAAACRSLLDRYPITQERLAASLSISPSALANRLRLLRLPPNVQAALRRQGLSERHARALLRVPSEENQLALVELASRKRLSVAQLEKRIDAQPADNSPPKRKMTAVVRDSRMVVNALLGTVRRLTSIGVPVQSRVEEGDGCVHVIITIPAPEAGKKAAT